MGSLKNLVELASAWRSGVVAGYPRGFSEAPDENERPGQFVLTGSQNFLVRRQISQSLAGRCHILHLLPFSRAELKRQPLQPVETITDRRLASSGDDEQQVNDAQFTGGYPRIHDKNIEPQRWLANSCQTYIERDVRALGNVGDMEAFGRFMGLCAGRTGHRLNLSALANDCGIRHTTARHWVGVLETSFVIMRLRPHHRNFNKRLVKSAKLYFLDTGLLCYLLLIRSAADLDVHAARGAIFESWVVAEAVKNLMNRGLQPEVYFWRDSMGHEIDLLIEAGGGRLLPVEAKSGQTFTSDFVKNLAWWHNLAGSVAARGAVVYGG